MPARGDGVGAESERLHEVGGSPKAAGDNKRDAPARTSGVEALVGAMLCLRSGDRSRRPEAPPEATPMGLSAYSDELSELGSS